MSIIKVITPSLTDANITTAKVNDNAITLAKMASGTDGNIISYDASGNPVAIATGSDGQVLTSTGAGSPPAFEAIPGGGKIGQVVSVTKTDTFSTSSTTYTDITGLTVNITPSATSSKILVLYSVSGGSQNHTSTQLLRDSTSISIGDAASSRTRATTGNFYENSSGSMIYTYAVNVLDSPSSSSQLTYKAQIRAEGATYVNRSRSDTNASYGARLASTITLLEVLA